MTRGHGRVAVWLEDGLAAQEAVGVADLGRAGDTQGSGGGSGSMREAGPGCRVEGSEAGGIAGHELSVRTHHEGLECNEPGGCPSRIGSGIRPGTLQRATTARVGEEAARAWRFVNGRLFR